MSFLINGSTPETLGLRVANRELVNQGIDRVVLEVTDASISSAQAFAYNAAVTITYNGVAWFKGKVAKLPKWGEAGAAGSVYEIWGPWWDLTLCTYEQYWNGAFTSRVIMGAKVVYGVAGVPPGVVIDGDEISYGSNEPAAVAVSTAVELRHLIDFAKQRGCAITRGTLPTGVLMPPEEFVDRKVSELIMAIVRWHPYAVTYFDYTTTPPTLHIKQRADLTAHSINLTGGTVTSVEAASREELLPACIVIRYECVTAGQSVLQFQDKWPSGATGRALGTFIATVTLDEGEAWNYGTPPIGAFLIDIPLHLAQYFYESYQDVMFDGSVTMVEENLPATAFMSKKLNLTNGLTAWSTMAAPVQSVTQDVRQGSTTLQFGSGENIGLDDLLRLQELFRKHRPKSQQARDRAPAAPTGQGPFEIYAAKVGADWRVYVYVGIVSTGEPASEVSVSDPAGAIIGWGGALDRWLYVEISPVTESVTLLDAAAVEFTEFRPLGAVTIADAKIAITASQYGAARSPVVNYADGTITTTGKFYFYLGSCLFNNGDAAPTPNNSRTGNFTLLFVPPNRLFLMPESNN